jgi:hypothetical protein
MICSQSFPGRIFRFRHTIPFGRRATTIMTTTTATTPFPAVPPITGSFAGSTAAVASAAPLELKGISWSGTAAHLSVDLNFNVDMAKGAGTIYITDGAVQTVIDRVTGQPTMRIVGGTDTHRISVADVHIVDGHVMFDVDGLTPKLIYSVVMAPGVLQTVDLRPFAGIRDTAEHQFPAPDGDIQPPTVDHIELSATTLKGGGTIDVTITFSEAVATLDPSALSADHATVSNLSTSDNGITWHATLHAPAAPTSTIGNQLSIDMSMVRDAAGNAGKGLEALAGYTVDTLAPTAAVRLDTAQLSATHTIDATIEFDAAVSGLSSASFHAPHATVSNVRTTDGVTWHATLTADAATEELSNMSYLSVDMSTVRDGAGNPGSGALVSQTGYYVDSRAPTAVSATLNRDALGAGGSIELTLAFSEEITTLDASAISAPHATVGGLLHVSANIWRVTLTGTDSASSTGNVVSVDMSKVQDRFGNSGSGTVQSATSYAVDGGAPALKSIALDGSHLYGNGTIGVTIQFSEAVPSLDASAILAPNATVSGLHTTDHLTWYATLTGTPGTSSGGGTVGIDMSKVHDAAGNAGSGTAHGADAYVVDTAAPTVAAISLDGALLDMEDQVVTATIRFSEAVHLTQDAISAPNAYVLSAYPADETMTVWQVALLAGGSGIDAPANMLKLDLSKVSDLVGNKGSGTVSSGNYAVDTRLPIEFYDTGWSDSDHVTSSKEQTLSGIFIDRAEVPGRIKVEVDTVLLDDDQVDVHHVSELGYATWNTDLSFTDGAHTVRVWFEDGSGAHGAVSSQTITVDTQRPAIVSPVEGAPAHDIAKAIDITFSEAVYWDSDSEGDNFATVSLWNLDKQTVTRIYVDDRNLSGDRKTLSLSADDLHLDGNTNYKIVLEGRTSDLAGNWLGENEVSFRTSGSYSDTTGPTALRAEAGSYSDGYGGKYSAGAVIDIVIRFSEPVHVVAGKTPSLRLDTGGVATYTSVGDDGREVNFRYTVGAGDADSARLAIADSSALVGAIADAAGNTLDAAHINYSALDPSSHGYGDGIIAIDTHAPSALTGVILDPDSDQGDSSTDHITKDATPTLSGTGAEPDAYEIRIYDGASLVGYGYAEDDGSWWATVNDSDSLADGAHHLSVTQVDRAGNESPVSAALDLTIDTAGPSAPPAPVLAAASDTGTVGDRITGDGTPTFSGTGAEPGRIVKLYADEREVGQAVSNDKGEWSITVNEPLADRIYSFGVKQFDLAGNKSGYSESLTVTIESGMPSAPTLWLDGATDTGAPNDNITSSTNPIIHGTGKAGASLELLDGTVSLLTTTVDASGHWSMIPALGTGTHVLSARLTDSAGNVSVSALPMTVVVDTGAAALAAPLLSSASDSGLFDNDGITNVKLPVLAGSGAEAGATIEVYEATTKLGQATADSGGAWSFTSPGELAAGKHSLTVRQIDLAGNTSAASAPREITIDAGAAAPDAPKLAHASDTGKLDNDAVTKLTTPTITGSGAEANARIEVYDGGVLLAKTAADGDGAWSITAGTLGAGLHSLTALQIDLAGNASTASTLLNLRIDTAAPGALGAPTLDVGSDSGASSTDGITNVKLPTIRGSGAEANASIEVYDGTTLLGETIADASGAWSYRTGELADGVHALSAAQVDLAGNRGNVSGSLAVTVDTLAPTIVARHAEFKSSKNWFELSFSEKIVFNQGAIDVEGPLGLKSHHAYSDMFVNWELEDEHGASVLELNLGLLSGLVKLQVNGNAIQDLAGNVAIIGIDEGFTIPGIPH